MSYVPTAAQIARHESGGGPRRQTRRAGGAGAAASAKSSGSGAPGEGETNDPAGGGQGGEEEEEPELHVREAKPKKAKVKPTVSKSSKEVLSCTTAVMHDEDGDENVAASYVAHGLAKEILHQNPNWRAPFEGQEMRVSIDGIPHSGWDFEVSSAPAHLPPTATTPP